MYMYTGMRLQWPSKPQNKAMNSNVHVCVNQGHHRGSAPIGTSPGQGPAFLGRLATVIQVVLCSK